MLAAYVEIDIFSKKRPGGAVNMGKNDIWIAAVAKVADVPLLTTDRDFEHLHGNLLKRHFIDPKTGKVTR
ncbi:MAG: hypothetical protein HY719_04610 [Planctomycetes bacterium]|nr:hypothetical protein [Planctomycetota bacterium]